MEVNWNYWAKRPYQSESFGLSK